jgi:hypothetical protein
LCSLLQEVNFHDDCLHDIVKFRDPDPLICSQVVKSDMRASCYCEIAKQRNIDGDDDFSLIEEKIPDSGLRDLCYLWLTLQRKQHGFNLCDRIVNASYKGQCIRSLSTTTLK